MTTNKTSIELDGKYSILFSLPKKCGCAVCIETKENIKSKMGEKNFAKVCKSLGII
jgi:hypothetical protein